MNRYIEGEAIDAIREIEDSGFYTEYLHLEDMIVDKLVARKLLVGEIDGKDTLALEQIRERHKARLEAERAEGLCGGIRDDFEVVRLLGIIDKLMRTS